MKKLIIVTLSFLIITTLGCRKECHYKCLPDIECEDQYELITKSYSEISRWVVTNEIKIINDDSTYIATFGPHPELGNIDFNTHTLLVGKVVTDFCEEHKSQGFLCKKVNENIYLFTIQYSLKNQCAGSGIIRHQFYGCIITSKLDSTSTINYKVEDINPL